MLKVIATRFQIFGVWRSLVARSAGGREVAGSNPVAPIFLRPFLTKRERISLKNRCPIKNTDPKYERIVIITYYSPFFYQKSVPKWK